jgi:uncharacterized protein (TIGR02300 family)
MAGLAWHVPTPFLDQLAGEVIVAKAEWGLKRTCQSCGARFYDMGRSDIVCPKCGAAFDPDVLLKAKRTKAVAAPERPVAPAVVEADELETADEDALVEGEAAEEEEEGVIEDTSELGEDTDDMAEVIENVDDEDDR